MDNQPSDSNYKDGLAKIAGEDMSITAEQQGLVAELRDMTQNTEAAKAARERATQYRHQAMQNLASPAGVFTGNSEDINREVARIKGLEKAQ